MVQNGTVQLRGSYTKTPLNVVPNLSLAIQTTYYVQKYGKALDVIIAPIYKHEMIVTGQLFGTFIVFYKDESQAIRSTLIIIDAERSAYPQSYQVVSAKTFTGQSVTINENDELVQYADYVNGTPIIKYSLFVPIDSPIAESLLEDEECSSPPGGTKCPGFGGKIKHFKSRKTNPSTKGGDDDQYNINFGGYFWGDPSTAWTFNPGTGGEAVQHHLAMRQFFAIL